MSKSASKSSSHPPLIYSIIDVETTGGSDRNRITEIAIIKTDGQKIIDSYVSLVNPLTHIPRSITLLTGITNDMVEHKPTFEQLSDEIFQFLEGTIFVAHNSSFDYAVLKNHYYEIGLAFSFKKLCTVRLSKKIIPDLPSYSLGKLCQSLNINVTHRHRAFGDAEATVKLFHLLIQRDGKNFIGYSLNQQSRETLLPPNIPKEMFDALPEKTGVYYFKNANHKILYVGKALNIKKRIITHFGEKSTKKEEMLQKTHFLDYQLTGNELLALLIEAQEIQKYFPLYNKALKYPKSNAYVGFYEGQDGFYRVDIFNRKPSVNFIDHFTSLVAARDFLYRIMRDADLCPIFLHLQKDKTNCLRGAQCRNCDTAETKKMHNKNLTLWLQNQQKKSFYIVGKGRAPEERTLVYIEEGHYKGYGFLSEQMPMNHWKDLLTFQKNDVHTQRIIKEFLQVKHHPMYQTYDC